MLQVPKYSSDEHSVLNLARNQLWCSKYMLGAANTKKSQEDKSFWMRHINKDRAKLRKIARAIRAKQLESKS